MIIIYLQLIKLSRACENRKYSLLARTNMPFNVSLCKANLYSEITVCTAAAEDIELKRRFVRLFFELFSVRGIQVIIV